MKVVPRCRVANDGAGKEVRVEAVCEFWRMARASKFSLVSSLSQQERPQLRAMES